MQKRRNVHKAVCFLVCGIALWGVFATPARADIYMYRDGNGVMHFSNVPTSPRYRLYVRENQRSFSPSPSSRLYDDLILDASRRHGVSFPLLKAIIRAESSFNPQAVSKKGAMGLMQIMPENARVWNLGDPFNPQENIMAGARYFRQMLDRYGGKVILSLSAYNAGPSVVDRYMSIPPIAETQQYVEKVLDFYKTYKASSGY